MLDTYLPHVERLAFEMRNRSKLIVLRTNSSSHRWEKTNIIHPSNFDTIPLSVEHKNFLIEDLDRFITRKEFCKKLDKDLKRGYFLYKYTIGI